MIEYTKNFSQILIDKEIPQNLIEIVSVFTPELVDDAYDKTANTEKKLLDYVEGDQNILVESFKSLNFMINYSDEIADFIIDHKIVEIICVNVMEDYSESTRIAALFLLGDIIKHENALFRLPKFQGLLKFLLESFLNDKMLKVRKKLIERCSAVIYLVSRMAKKTDTDILDCFVVDMMNIFYFSFETVPECIVDAISGTFYLMYYDQEFASLPSTELIIANTIQNENPFVIYFLLQILKICNICFPNERLFDLYTHIDFQCFNFFLTINEPLSFATANFFCSLFQRGFDFIHLCGNNFDALYQAYFESSLEIKFALLNAFDVAFIVANKQQLTFFINKNYDEIIFDSIETQENIDLCLDAMISIANFNIKRFQNHQELYDDLSLLNVDSADEETIKKISYLLSLLTLPT